MEQVAKQNLHLSILKTQLDKVLSSLMYLSLLRVGLDAIEISSKLSILSKITEDVYVFRKQVFIIMDIVNHVTLMMPSVIAENIVSSQNSTAEESNFLAKFWVGFCCSSQWCLFPDCCCKILKTMRVFCLCLLV